MDFSNDMQEKDDTLREYKSRSLNESKGNFEQIFIRNLENLLNEKDYQCEGMSEQITILMNKISEKFKFKSQLKKQMIEDLEKLKVLINDMDNDYNTISKLFEIVFNDKLTEEQQNEYLNDVESR